MTEAAAARDEALAFACARFCAEAGGDVDALNRALQVVPIQGRPWPFDPPRSSDFDLNSEAGRAAYRAGIAAARLRYLEGRADVLRERQAFRQRLSEPTFGGLDLDGLVDTTRNDPAARAELHLEQFEQRQAALETERARVVDREAARKARQS